MGTFINIVTQLNIGSGYGESFCIVGSRPGKKQVVVPSIRHGRRRRPRCPAYEVTLRARVRYRIGFRATREDDKVSVYYWDPQL